MTLTEDEAKTKRCQESFGDRNLGSGYIEARAVQMGTQAYATSPTVCLGSGCMAWRWATPQVVHKYNQPTGEIIVKGYCGKAGRPVA